jgi:glycosyltransferase involved in cell wall biosynthesis
VPAIEKTLVWLVAEERGGIRDYADELWPQVQAQCGAAGWRAELVTSPPIKSRQAVRQIIAQITALKPSLIHVQHEFGLFGSKVPFRYRFPELACALHAIAPVVATAHNVLFPEHELPWRGKGWKGIGRLAFNRLVLPFARREWLAGTWGGLAGVVVHSRLQERAIFSSGCLRVATIPHFVPVRDKIEPAEDNNVVVFGFFSPEKGQDVVIQAWKNIRAENAKLVLAGGVRRDEDRGYFEICRKLISDLELESRVEITGYVPAAKISEIYASAALVVAPFRETTGSGSLAQAFARGMPVLTSDLPLNTELLERVPACIELFRAGDVSECAAKIDGLLASRGSRKALSEASYAYAERFSPAEIIKRHFAFYGEVVAHAQYSSN